MKSILIALTMVFSLSLVDSKKEEPVDIWTINDSNINNQESEYSLSDFYFVVNKNYNI